LRIGIIYLTYGPESPYVDKAMHHIYQAVKGGNSDAMLLFGRLHVTKTLVFSNEFLNEYQEEQACRTAMFWYRKAIKLGNIAALYYAGVLLENGTTVEVNSLLAIKLYQQASKLGFVLATQKLDEMEEIGII